MNRMRPGPPSETGLLKELSRLGSTPAQKTSLPVRTVPIREMEGAGEHAAPSGNARHGSGFAKGYYNACMPPLPSSHPRYCFWCTRLVNDGNPQEEEEEEPFCQCVCHICHKERTGCSENGCRGFFPPVQCRVCGASLLVSNGKIQTEDRSPACSHTNSLGAWMLSLMATDTPANVLEFRKGIRDYVFGKFSKDRLLILFRTFSAWYSDSQKTVRSQRNRSQSSRTSTAGGERVMHVCPFEHVQFSSSSGYGGFCGACRVKEQINPLIVRSGKRPRRWKED